MVRKLQPLAAVRELLIGFGLLFLSLPATAADHPATDEPAANATTEQPEKDGAGSSDTLDLAIEGYLSMEARLRFAGGETDLDIYTHAYADLVRRGETTLRVRFNGRLFLDAGGSQAPGDLLFDSYDALGSDAHLRLYEGFGEVERGRATVRVGRQFLDEGLYLHFDGVRGFVRTERVEISVLGGVGVRFGEPSRSGNWLAGLVATGKVSDTTRARLEYYHVVESFPGINSPVTDPEQQPVVIPAQDFEDDLVGMSVWHRFQDTLRAFGRFTLLNGDANELHLRLRWFTKDGRWNAVLEWYQLFERLFAVTNDLTPFVPMLGAYDPFWRLSARVTHRLDEDWVLVGGITFRSLTETDAQTAFNHEYFQGFAHATRSGLMDGKLDVTLTVTGYDSDGNDVLALGGHADLRVSDTVEISGGIDYSLYKYIWFQDTEREDVWTLSLRVRWKARDKVRVVGGISVDDDRFETYTTIFVRVTVRF